LYLAVALAVALAGMGFYLWQAYPLQSWEALFSKRQAPPESKTEPKVAAVKTQPAIPASRGGSAPTAVGVPPPPVVQDVDPDIVRLSSIEARLSDEQRKRPPEVVEVQEKVLPLPAEREEGHVLKAVVVERTWIRISIDDGEPREYLFNPGDRLQWKAKEGFSLIVGNAGGIELELNGQGLGKLGNLAQVIRLKLPEGYTPKRTEG
jgi:cytoskeleton protein RodZ